MCFLYWEDLFLPQSYKKAWVSYVGHKSVAISHIQIIHSHTYDLL